MEEARHFQLANDALVRVLADGHTKATYCPSWQREDVCRRFHDGLGHLKMDSIFDLVARRYWWPGMKQALQDYIRQCPMCQLDEPTRPNESFFYDGTNRSNTMVERPEEGVVLSQHPTVTVNHGMFQNHLEPLRSHSSHELSRTFFTSHYK